MSILIIGADGSMGKRYQAILKFLNKPFKCVDKQDSDRTVGSHARESEAFIVASPTETHPEIIRSLLKHKKPILCEKPITKHIPELKALRKDIETADVPFRMMFQYKMLEDSNRVGPSRYNYFRHGNDGLVWDCMQVIGLARSEVVLKESSPIWSCMVNGKALKLSDMDAAYIMYIQSWLKAPKQDLGYLQSVHEKVDEMERRSADE